MYDLTVVCCYNRKDILDSMLMKSVEEQKDVQVETILYHNTYPSAAEAYNHALSEASTDYLVFVHQDIYFDDPYYLSKLLKLMKEDPDSLYGICGSRIENGLPQVYSRCIHGIQNRNIGKETEEVVEVAGLDEVMVAFSKKGKHEFRFDPEHFTGWHLFVSDLCVDARIHDCKIKVVPFQSRHKNLLEMPNYLYIYKIYPDVFFTYLNALFKKYKGKTEFISCPCFTSSMKPAKFHFRAVRLRTVMRVRNMLRKLSLR